MSAVVASRPFAETVRVATALAVAGALGVVAVFPYVLELLPPQTRAALPPLAVLLPLQVLQALVIFTLLALAGLHLAPRVGLDAPWLRRWLGAADDVAPRPFAWREVLLGAIAAVAAVALIQAALHGAMPPPRAAEPPHPTAVQGFFASFYGGIAEELQLRLFLMTLVAWLLVRFARARRTTAIVVANAFAAIAFGAGHLPAAAHVWPLEAAVVVYVIAGNASAGVVFGALYARHGLEAAIATHFVADLGLHVLAPLVGVAS